MTLCCDFDRDVLDETTNDLTQEARSTQATDPNRAEKTLKDNQWLWCQQTILVPFFSKIAESILFHYFLIRTFLSNPLQSLLHDKSLVRQSWNKSQLSYALVLFFSLLFFLDRDFAIRTVFIEAVISRVLFWPLGLGGSVYDTKGGNPRPEMVVSRAQTLQVSRKRGLSCC